MFIVDTNGDRSLDVAEEVENSFTDDTLSFDVETQDLSTSGVAEIHINTLAPFYGDGPGDYVISSLKKMTGTKNFLALPDNEKRCQIEDFVECKNRNFFAEGKHLCGNCIPWILQMALNDIEVMLIKSQLVIRISKVLSFSLSRPQPALLLKTNVSKNWKTNCLDAKFPAPGFLQTSAKRK